MRRNETPQQRLDRLQAKLDALKRAGGDTSQLEARIKALRDRINGGMTQFPRPGQQKVQLDDDPSTWNSEALAELAPPRGMDTIFYDNEAGDKQNKIAKRQKDKVNNPPNDNAEVNRTRQSETTQERIARLQAKLKGASAEQKAQLKARIDALKKRLAAGEDKPSDTTNQKKNPTPTAAKDTTNNPTANKADTNKTRQGEDLADRLKRLQDKLKNAKTPEQKKSLQARIDALKKRIAAGDTTGRNRNQPGTPQRPYRNREVTYKPMGYGGTLRI